jgi:hypothetical protein
MNYSILLTGNMNARRTPDSSINNIIRQLPAGTRVEGDELSADSRWLNVLIIDGMQVNEPTWIATYTTSGKLVTNPPVDPGLAVQVELSFVSASPVSITLNGVPVGQELYTGSIILTPKG